jgi:hypothetical protein
VLNTSLSFVEGIPQEDFAVVVAQVQLDIHGKIGAGGIDAQREETGSRSFLAWLHRDNAE